MLNRISENNKNTNKSYLYNVFAADVYLLSLDLVPPPPPPLGGAV